jgi:hypothetical protein
MLELLKIYLDSYNILYKQEKNLLFFYYKNKRYIYDDATKTVNKKLNLCLIVNKIYDNG